MLEHTLFNLAVRSANLICQQASPHSLTPTVQWFSVRYATIDITAQYCTYQSFPRKIANYLSHLIFVVSTWIAFSFLWSFQYFIVSHRLIPPLLKKKIVFEKVYFGECQGIKISVQEIDFMCLCRLWMCSRVDDRLQHKSQVYVTVRQRAQTAELCPN